MGYRVLGGRYELVEQLGRGGMGTVHRAVDNRLRRTVAVKVLSEGLAHYSEARARFQREAHAVAALNHPAVATIHDVGEEPEPEGPRPFLVMEYVEGETLAQALRSGPLPVAQAVAVGCEVLDALHHSHRHGIVHRDIKPSNIMRATAAAGAGAGRTSVKVLDFGIAKALTEAATRLTGSGAVPGTPAYLSPEQITGADIDHRADLYAMGCLLYELLTGRVPFPAASPFAVMHDHLFTAPQPVTALQPRIPEAVGAVVMRALAKNPADRFADADEMRLALQTALAATAASTTHLAHPAPRPRLRVALTRLRAAARPPSPGALLAVLGALLCLLSAHGQMVDTDHFGRAADIAAVLALLVLPLSPRLSCALAWGPAAETFAVNSDLRRDYVGWAESYATLAALLCLTAAVCAVTALRRPRATGPLPVVAFWATAAPGIWYFLDDLRKLYVFYALLAAVGFVTGVQEAWLLLRARRWTRTRRAADAAARV